MNIDKWLYPRPPVTWKLSEYGLQVIWVPVHKKILNNKTKIISIKQELEYSIEKGPISDHISDPLIDEIVEESDNTEHLQDKDLISQVIQDCDNLMSTVVKSPKISYLPSSAVDQNVGHTNVDESIALSQSCIWISAEENMTNQVDYRIPCMFTVCESRNANALIYFHSNAEDIRLCYPMCDDISTGLGVHVIAVEYPTYSYYTADRCNEAQICKDALSVYDFLLNTLRWPAGTIRFKIEIVYM